MACDLTTGLIVLYHFTGNVNDSSGSGNNATNSGAILTTDKNSVSNQAYSFNGSNTEIYLPSLSFYDADFTLVLWGEFSSSSINEYLINFRGERYIDIRTDGGLRIRNTAGTIQYTTGESLQSLSGWHMIVARYTKSTGEIELSVDGGTFSSNVTGVTNIGTDTSRMSSIGALDTSVGVFAGKIDEVRIYTNKMDQDTIDALYSGYDNPSCGVVQYNAIFSSTNF